MRTMTVSTSCPFCGNITNVSVDPKDFSNWKNGTNAQDAFPYLSATERECLISGICGPCWDATFAQDDESDDCDYEIGYDPYMGCFSDDC